MANIKSYRLKTNSVGLPDTTNIQDPQLRLFLDRLNQTFSDLQITVKGLSNLSNAKSLTAALLKEPSFVDFIKKESERISKKEAQKEIQKNEELKRVQNKVLEYISVSPTSLNVKPNDKTKSLDVSYSPSGILNYQKGVTWSSSDENIAKISDDGKITPVSVGECVFTATSEYNTNITAYCNVKVTNEFDIFIYAHTAWSSSDGNNVFTENKTPSENDPVWNTNSEIIVSVGDNQSEAEAKIAASAGVVSTVERRDFICETKYVYWRDVNADVANGYTRISGLQTAVHVGGSEAKFYGKKSDDGSEISLLFSKALNPNSYVSTDQHKEYDADDCLVAENIEILNDSDTPWYVHWVMTSYSQDNIDIFDGNSRYIVPTGETVLLNGYDRNGDGLISEKWIEITTYDGIFPCWVSERFLNGTHPDPHPWASIQKPYIDNSGFIATGGDARITFTKKFPDDELFKYDGVWYRISGRKDNFVFKADKFFAWSTAPCGAEVKTVYTKSADGDQYGLVNGNDFTVLGYVKQSGNGIYSITVNSKVYYTTANFGV